MREKPDALAPSRRAAAVFFVSFVALTGIAAAGPAPGSGKLPKDIREVATKHYVLRTNIKGDLVDDLARRMDGMYEEYTRRMKEFAPPKDAPKLPAYLFNKHQEYKDFTGMPNVGGVFVGFG